VSACFNILTEARSKPPQGFISSISQYYFIHYIAKPPTMTFALTDIEEEVQEVQQAIRGPVV
jgi:hypothetical protein